MDADRQPKANSWKPVAGSWQLNRRPRRRCRRDLLGPTTTEARVRGSDLHPIEKDDSRNVDPHQKHHDRRDRAVHAEAMQIPHVSGKTGESATPQKTSQDRADPDISKANRGI